MLTLRGPYHIFLTIILKKSIFINFLLINKNIYKFKFIRMLILNKILIML